MNSDRVSRNEFKVYEQERLCRRGSAAYYAGLKNAQQKLDYAGLTAFIADAMTATVAEIKETRDALARLQSDWLRRRTFRKGSAAIAALRLLPNYPVVTVRRLEQMLGVSFQAASNAVRDLEQVGLLKEKTGYQRNRMFIAGEVLAIVNRSLRQDDDHQPADGILPKV